MWLNVRERAQYVQDAAFIARRNGVYRFDTFDKEPA
jgi:hypothetical protein